MGLAKKNIMIAPSTDKRTLAQLESVNIESGFYYVKEEKTINGTTSDRWTVICISSEERESMHCYTQIWIQGATGTTQIGTNKMFIRTSAEDSSAWSTFTSMV